MPPSGQRSPMSRSTAMWRAHRKGMWTFTPIRKSAPGSPASRPCRASSSSKRPRQVSRLRALPLFSASRVPHLMRRDRVETAALSPVFILGLDPRVTFEVGARLYGSDMLSKAPPDITPKETPTWRQPSSHHHPGTGAKSPCRSGWVWTRAWKRSGGAFCATT
ncbi:hypothetical protein EMEDMD4_510029 [Sinorhizobium medicae]|uniref:Uncharacterized protein n=1 Tax=Sinorhizobium medicae TaxID=110321 RepID=A0A508X1B2_9HYPH|nr:hypothetical protein EMEDMD4_510029 [Sinorhizobium medicae]